VGALALLLGVFMTASRFRLVGVEMAASIVVSTSSSLASSVGARRDKQKLFYALLPRSSRGRRPRGLPLDAQLRIIDEARRCGAVPRFDR
jgi:hypothetical protein